MVEMTFAKNKTMKMPGMYMTSARLLFARKFALFQFLPLPINLCCSEASAALAEGGWRPVLGCAEVAGPHD